jgi:hypothetical protein
MDKAVLSEKMSDLEGGIKGLHFPKLPFTYRICFPSLFKLRLWPLEQDVIHFNTIINCFATTKV